MKTHDRVPPRRTDLESETMRRTLSLLMAGIVLLAVASIGWAEDAKTDKKADAPTLVELRVQMHRTLAALIEARAADKPDAAKIEQLTDKLQTIRKQMWAQSGGQGWRPGPDPGPGGPWFPQQCPYGGPRMGRGPGSGGPGPGSPGPGNWQGRGYGRGYGRGQGGPGMGRGMGYGMGYGPGCSACPCKCCGADCSGCPCNAADKDCAKDCANCPLKDCGKRCDVDLGVLGKYLDGDTPPSANPVKPASKSAAAAK